MMRWAWAKSVAAGLACAGFVAGQAPPARVSVSPPAHSSPPEAKDGPREGDVIALPTAGQPERKVKVLRVTRSDGGEAMADLQDQATGARYTVPARMLTAKPRPTAPPARSGLLHNPTRWNKSARPSATPAARPQYAAPHPTPKTVTYKPPVPPRPAPKEERPVPRAESPSQTIVTRPPAPAAAPVPSPPVTPLPYERPSPAPVAPPSLIVFPSTTAFAPTAPAVVAPPIPEVRPAGLFVPLPPQLTPPIPDADPMADETEPYLRDLFGA